MRRKTTTHQTLLRARPEQPEKRIKGKQTGAHDFIGNVASAISLALSDRFSVISKKKFGVGNVTFRPRFEHVTDSEWRLGLAFADEAVFSIAEADRNGSELAHLPVRHWAGRFDDYEAVGQSNAIRSNAQHGVWCGLLFHTGY